MGFAHQISISLPSAVFLLVSLAPLSHEYDPLDPNGNITIKWDIIQDNGDRYDARVSVLNYQLFRHIEPPGWRLSWVWPDDDVIWEMWGAEATLQGNCSRFKGDRPHSCEKKPIIIDLVPGVPFKTQVANCCKDGILTSFNQDPSKYGAMFQMNVGRGEAAAAAATAAGGNKNETILDAAIPNHFNIGVDGYSCGTPESVPPSRFQSDSGRRWTQAVRTWNITCIYSQFKSSTNPKCCVSLSSFYNSTIVPCPHCSCNCGGFPGGPPCVLEGEPLVPLEPVVLHEHSLKTVQHPDLVRCTDHMCPIRIHWHVKQNYKEYWRVKITVTNLNTVKNYTQWNLVVQHPNLDRVAQVYSFNYHPLDVHGYLNDTGMFWGIQYYNDMLLQSGRTGNVQSELLLGKETNLSSPSLFTLREGWAFPRKISFNGDDCVMPPPDSFPRLPNEVASSSTTHNSITLLLIMELIVLLYTLGIN